MRLLPRYILFELLRVFVLLLGTLTILLVFVGVFGEAQQNGLGLLQVAEIVPFVVLNLLPFTIPATLLLTVSVVYGRIAADQEITAAKAAGINVLSLLLPSFVLGAILSVCSLVLSDQVIPWAVESIDRKVTLLMEDIFLDQLRSKHRVSNEEEGYSIDVIDMDGKTLIRPTFQYAPRGRRKVTLQAEKATLEFDLEKQQVLLHLVGVYMGTPGENGFYGKETHRYFPLKNKIKKPKARDLSITDINRELKAQSQNLEISRQQRDIEIACALVLGDFEQLQQDDVVEYDKKFTNGRKDLAKLETAIHSRFALSSSCLFFALVGSPFAIIRAQRQFLTSFFMCFLPILILYYPLTLGMMNLAKSGTVNPVWAMWVSNALLGIVAFFVLRRVLKH